MNRKKKLQSLFKKRLKRARAKLDGRPKGEGYVSKADRAKAEANVEDAAIESDIEQSCNEGGYDKSVWGQALHSTCF